MKALLIVQFILFVTASLIGCGSKKSGDGSTPGAQYCPSHQIYHPSYGCINRGHCPQGQGLIPGTNECITANDGYHPGLYGNRVWAQALTVTSNNTYKKFLKDNWVCDVYNVFGYNTSWGTQNCSNWDKYAGVYLEVSSTSLPTQGVLTIVAYAHQWGGVSSGVPVSLTGTLHKIQTDGVDGFEFRTTGNAFTPGYNAWFSARAEKDLLTADTIRLKLTYDNKQFGTANVYRVQ